MAMALPPLASVSDLAAWVGQEIPDSDPRAGAVLSAASALVRSYAGATWTNDDGELDGIPEVVSAVVVQVAGRVWVNPDGLTSVTVDDGTRRWESKSGLRLTEDEKEVLAPYVDDVGPRGFGVLSTTRGSLPGDGTIYVPTGPPPSGPPFPWYSTEDF